MIIDHTKRIPDIQGLILLDCWEPTVRNHFFKDKFYINLIEQLKGQEFIYIVNSASRLNPELNKLVMANTLEVCDNRTDHHVIENLSKHAGNEQLSILLSRYLFNQQTINIVTPEDFVWFCNDYLAGRIQNWLVAGHTWQMCSHDGALGLRNLARITMNHKINFYATDYSFCTITGQTATKKEFEEDRMSWCKVKNFGYRLML